jgi:hypothetical protein
MLAMWSAYAGWMRWLLSWVDMQDFLALLDECAG